MNKKRVIKTPVKMVEKSDHRPTPKKKEPDFRNYLNFFEFEIKLPGSGEKVKIKPLTTGQIKGLLTYDGDEEDFSLVTTIFDDLIQESVTTENFDITNLYLQDRFYLLLEIRKKTKGAKHQFNWSCPECKSQSMKTFDLDSLPLTPMPKVDRIVNLNDQITLEMDFLKRKDEFEASEALKIIKEDADQKLTELQEQAEFALLLEASGIKKIMVPEGEQRNLTLFDKKYFIENIPKFLYQKIKDWYELGDFGVEFHVNIECEHCNHKVETEITYDNFFF